MENTILQKRKSYIDEVLNTARNYEGADRETFFEIVRSALELGMSQAEMARKFKVNSSTISRWKSGQNYPLQMVRESVVRQIADYLEEKHVNQRSNQLA